VSPLLELDELHVWFDLGEGRELHAVQGVSLALEPGRRLGLVGESGCGKTTTVLGLLGLLPPSASVAGRVLLNGEDILAGGESSIRPHRWSDLAIVFQGAMNALNPVQTVEAQIVEALELHGRAAEQRGSASPSCSRPSASRATAAGASRTSSPAACASAPRSRWRSPATRACSWRTSRRRRST
jgi:ABC-type glutathione transport system ATPase component